jgi:hypothetical protein
MKVQHQIDSPSATTSREVATTILVDLDETIEQLTREIASEEKRVRIFDVNAPTYPILAKSLVARRDNLRLTAAALVKWLRMIDPPNIG